MSSDNAARAIPASAIQSVGERVGYAGRDILGRLAAQGIDLNLSRGWVSTLQEKAANNQWEKV